MDETEYSSQLSIEVGEPASPSASSPSSSSEPEVLFIPSGRGDGQMLVIRDQNGSWLYKKDGQGRNKIVTYWKCWRRRTKNDCCGHVKMINSTIINRQEHDLHTSDEKEVAIRLTRKRKMECAAENPTLGPKRIYGLVMDAALKEELAHLHPEDQVDVTRTWTAHAPSIQRYKKKADGPPGSIEEMSKYKLGQVEVDFLLFDINLASTASTAPSPPVEPKRMIAWANPKFLSYLHNGKVFGDGTFKIVPRGFDQLYTIHAYQIEGQVKQLHPVIIALLPDRTQGTYARSLEEVSKKVLEVTKRTWTPREFQIDYEAGMKSAIERT